MLSDTFSFSLSADCVLIIKSFCDILFVTMLLYRSVFKMSTELTSVCTTSGPAGQGKEQ